MSRGSLAGAAGEFLAGACGARRAHGAVQPGQGLRVHRLDPVDQGGRPRVGGPGLDLLGVGEGQRAQREDLVDLGAVVELAGAFRGQFGVVVQDDRRGQHDLPAALGIGQHRPAAHVLALGHGRLGPHRRIGHRDELAAGGAQDHVRGDQRAGQRIFPALRHGFGRGPVFHPDPEPDRLPRTRQRNGQHRHRARQRGPPAHRVPGLATGSGWLAASGSRSSPPGTANSSTWPPSSWPSPLPLAVVVGVAVAEQVSGADRELDLAFDRLVPGRRVGARPLGASPLHLQEPQDDLNGGLAGVLEHALALGEGAFRRVGRRVPRRHDHAELPAAAVLGGRGPVRVEDVALVEDRVGHPPDGVEVHGCLASGIPPA